MFLFNSIPSIPIPIPTIPIPIPTIPIFPTGNTSNPTTPNDPFSSYNFNRLDPLQDFKIKQSPIQIQEKIVYVDRPVETIKFVEKPVETIKYVDNYIDKIIEKPIETIRFVDKIIEKPVETIKYIENIVEKPVYITNTIEKTNIIEKIVEKPVIQTHYVEKINTVIDNTKVDALSKQVNELSNEKTQAINTISQLTDINNKQQQEFNIKQENMQNSLNMINKMIDTHEPIMFTEQTESNNYLFLIIPFFLILILQK